MWQCILGQSVFTQTPIPSLWVMMKQNSCFPRDKMRDKNGEMARLSLHVQFLTPSHVLRRLDESEQGPPGTYPPGTCSLSCCGVQEMTVGHPTHTQNTQEHSLWLCPASLLQSGPFRVLQANEHLPAVGSIDLSICLPVYLSIYPSQSVYLSIHFICLFVY